VLNLFGYLIITKAYLIKITRSQLMEVYLKPIISACYVFPILAVIFTIPYILYEYHKYGSIIILRTGIVYTSICLHHIL